MSSVIFEYRGIKTTIQCSNSDKMKDICHKYASKINKNISFLLFLYGGNCVDLELNFNEQANKFDRNRNEMNILVYNNDFELQCPKCGERISLEIYDWIDKFKNNEKEKLNELKSQIEMLNDVHDINRIRIKVKNINLIITAMIEEIEKSKNYAQKYINNLDEKNNINNSKNENLMNNNAVNNNEKDNKTPNISESNQINNIQTQGNKILHQQKNVFTQPLFNNNMHANMNKNRFNSRDSFGYMKNNKCNTMNNNMFRIMNNKNMNNNMNAYISCNNMNSNMNINMSNNNMNINMFNNNMNNNMNLYTNNNTNYSMNNKMTRNMSCSRIMNNNMNVNMYNNNMGNNNNMINNYINNNIFNSMNKNMNNNNMFNNMFNNMNNNMNNWTNVKQNEKNKVKDSFGIYFRCRQKSIFFNLEPDTPLNTVLVELREKYDWLNEINIKGLSFNGKKISLNLSCNQAGIPNEASIDILE